MEDKLSALSTFFLSDMSSKDQKTTTKTPLIPLDKLDLSKKNGRESRSSRESVESVDMFTKSVEKLAGEIAANKKLTREINTLVKRVLELLGEDTTKKTKRSDETKTSKSRKELSDSVGSKSIRENFTPTGNSSGSRKELSDSVGSKSIRENFTPTGNSSGSRKELSDSVGSESIRENFTSTGDSSGSRKESGPSPRVGSESIRENFTPTGNSSGSRKESGPSPRVGSESIRENFTPTQETPLLKPRPGQEKKETFDGLSRRTQNISGQNVHGGSPVETQKIDLPRGDSSRSFLGSVTQKFNGSKPQQIFDEKGRRVESQNSFENGQNVFISPNNNYRGPMFPVPKEHVPRVPGEIMPQIPLSR